MQLDNTTDPYSAPSPPSYSYEMLNENTDITSKILLTEETHYSTSFDIEDKPSIVIQTSPYVTHTQKTC